MVLHGSRGIYPHCGRTGDELVFRLVDEWFINMDWRDEIADVTRQIRWIPDAIDGQVDHVVSKCASCALAMAGHPDHSLAVEGYQMHFCSEACRTGFGKDATDIIHELSGGKQPRDNIYFNVVHTVDGAWNLDGQAMSNDELGQAIAQG